jgi:siroheme synthase
VNGNVYLVGAGPGDPRLITLKGLECIAKADVIIYDRLASNQLFEHAKPDVEYVYVGKKAG